MDDKERLERIVGIAKDRFGGIDELTYERWLDVLESRETQFGYDNEGRIKVAFYDAQPYEKSHFLEANVKSGDCSAFTFLRTRLSQETAETSLGFRVVCIFVQDVVNRETVKLMAEHGVQLIALRSTGFNNVDLAACKEYGVDVVRVTAYSAYSVAEYAISLMLSLNRRLHVAAERVERGDFTLKGLVGFDMHGKTVGVVGTGKIGACTANILLGLGCRVLVYDKFINQELSSRQGVAYVELDQLLRESDIITLHVPLLPDTHYLIDTKAISKMKNGVMLINTSRGALIDTRALIAGLKSGKIGAAGLDVYEVEEGVFFEDFSAYDRVMQDDVLARLCTFNNVLVTSHQAFLTKEALTDIATTTVKNIAEFKSGKRGKELTNYIAS
jgi:D-lactate dehydrogenase